jgi:hypothetical protein
MSEREREAGRCRFTKPIVLSPRMFAPIWKKHIQYTSLGHMSLTY